MFVIATQFCKINYANASNSLEKEAREYCFARLVGVTLHGMSLYLGYLVFQLIF